MKKSPLPVQSSPRGAEKPVIGKESLVKLLRWHFGHSNFRGKQLEAIQAVLSGRDCFCLMPTGGGKSLCFQIPALAKPSGIVLVVCPLIALMENQVMALKEKGIAAEFLSSAQTAGIRNKIHEDLNSGKPSIRLLYVTPELIATPGFMSKLRKIHSRGLLNLVAIDEAHCISTWGHDFRPSYRQLSSLRNCLPDVPILALTATAVPKVQNDVMGSLNLHDPLVLKSSFNRPNIYYEVRYKDLLDDAYADLSSIISSCGNVCAIVYCLERTTCDTLSAHLSKNGISCAAYHAGLTNKLRSSVLDSWISSKTQVVVATVAFGMGIDRKDVRLVIHFNIPKSMEAFYQESGRAGRDQLPSRSLLYYSIDDRKKMEFILKNAETKKFQSSSSAELSKKSLSDFLQMVEYCESSGCRRRKILESFGEQVSTSLCERACDSCKHPNLVSKYLEELNATCAASRSSSFSRIVVGSSQNTSQDQMSEYWNRRDEASCSEEDISQSDESGDDLEAAKSLTESKSRKLGLDEKLDLLERAEENYYQSKKNKQASINVSQSLREASKQRISNALFHAQQRLGNVNIISVETSAGVLETECFRQYGKNRTVYHSRVLGTVRWLSTASSTDIASRLGIHRPPSNSHVPNEETPETSPSSLLDRRIPTAETEIHGNTCLEASTSTGTCYRANLSASMHLATTSSPAQSACFSRKLPAIPSFSEFVSSKKLQGNRSNTSRDPSPKRQRRRESAES